MDYYKKRMFATMKIKKLINAEIPLEKMYLVILEEYGLSKKFVDETYNLIIKDQLGNFNE